MTDISSSGTGDRLVHTTMYSRVNGTLVPAETVFGFSDPAGGFIPVRTGPPTVWVRSSSHVSPVTAASVTATAAAIGNINSTSISTGPSDAPVPVPLVAGSLAFAGLLLAGLTALGVVYCRRRTLAARRAIEACGKQGGGEAGRRG
ncbi:hypothetical protein F5X99DRAFT_409167 [Biscogniauxia marginata]|nr:hypothetical protein F5X99DRAFT_409167 [Biscogniauxia marginata]